MTETFPIPLGRYLLIERLAVGGMAELFRARAVERAGERASDRASKGPGNQADSLAIKRLLPHLGADPYYRTMFLDEAKLTARLSHENIIRTFDYGDHAGTLFMVMELVDGLDGLSILRECAHRKVRLPIELVVIS